MTFDLTAARALHDRDPNNPADCATCSDPDGNPHPWPCPTATALGATGRAEWTNTPTNQAICGQAICGAHRDNEVIDNYPCLRTSGHPNHHTDTDGDTWQ